MVQLLGSGILSICLFDLRKADRLTEAHSSDADGLCRESTCYGSIAKL